MDSCLSASDCYLTKNGSCGVRAYGSCALAISYCDLSGNGVSPAVSVDERQDLDVPGEDVFICIRNSSGDVVSDPPSQKWIGGSSSEKSITASFNTDQITINAIIGQSVEVGEINNILSHYNVYIYLILSLVYTLSM